MRKINIFSLIIGIAGFAFAIFMYVNSIKKSEITYSVLTPPYKMYDNELNQSLNIFLDSIKVDRNIYLATFSIWNTGNQTIQKQNIRKSIEINFSGIDKVISYKIIKEIERGVSEFEFTQKNDSTFLINWKYFDPHNGIKVQLTYFGKETIECKVNGSILETKIKKFIPNKPFLLYRYEPPLWGYIIGMISLIVIAIMMLRDYARRESKFTIFLMIFYYLGIFIYLGYLGYGVYFRAEGIPF